MSTPALRRREPTVPDRAVSRPEPVAEPAEPAPVPAGGPPQPAPPSAADPAELPVATSSGSGVRRLPEGILPDLSDLAELLPPVEPPPVPREARRQRAVIVERVDFEALCAQYGPRVPERAGDGYFPVVPGIPTLVFLPSEVEPEPALDGPRLAVLGTAALLGGLLALL